MFHKPILAAAVEGVLLAASINADDRPHAMVVPIAWPKENRTSQSQYIAVQGPFPVENSFVIQPLARVSPPKAFTPIGFTAIIAPMERPLASIQSATRTDSVPVLVDVVPPGTAQDQRPDIPDRLKLGEDLPSPELIRAALRLWRDIRETGVVPEENCLCHIVWCILSLADHRVLSSPVLAALEEQIEAARDRDKDPFERQLEEEADKIVAGTLREYGEADMALLYETDRVEFHRLYDAGRKRSFAPAETGNATISAVIRSRQVKRLSLRAITGGLTSYWSRLAHTFSGR